ncbi:MAG: hypothetical protein LIO65_07395 [Odoribacter sp.]|nr:hypothetical protein [Odoribacter sp.]
MCVSVVVGAIGCIYLAVHGRKLLSYLKSSTLPPLSEETNNNKESDTNDKWEQVAEALEYIVRIMGALIYKPEKGIPVESSVINRRTGKPKQRFTKIGAFGAAVDLTLDTMETYVPYENPNEDDVFHIGGDCNLNCVSKE